MPILSHSFMRNRKSIIWKISTHELFEIVKKSFTISQILSNFGLENKGHNYRTLKKRLEEEHIEYGHIKLGKNSNLGRKFSRRKIPLNKILVENSSYNRCDLKKRLIKEKILDNICSNCHMLPLWNNKPLSLQMDHINGLSNDNRIENLRLLCPNCHSQTPTFAGKSNKKRLSSPIKNNNWRHLPRPSKRKVIRPSKEELIELLKTHSMLSLGKKMGVSDKSIAKWKKIYNI